MYMYTSKGYKFVEQDDDIPERRRHCARCGAWLTTEPTQPHQTFHVVYEAQDFLLEEEWEPISYTVPRLATPEEIEQGKALEEWKEPAWTCRRCGCVHDLDEMWI